MGPDSNSPASKATTTVTLNNQGPLDLLEAAVTGLDPNAGYTIGLVPDLNGSNQNFQPLASFQTNAAGAQIVESLGPLRQIVASSQQAQDQREDQRFLEIVPTGGTQPVQVQLQTQ
jgi:hypothetical protein